MNQSYPSDPELRYVLGKIAQLFALLFGMVAIIGATIPELSWYAEMYLVGVALFALWISSAMERRSKLYALWNATIGRGRLGIDETFEDLKEEIR